MTAEIHIILGQADNVLLIPSTALSEPDEKGKVTVRVMEQNGTISEKPVETGLNDKVLVEIISGLKEGEKIVTGDSAGGPAVPRSRRGRSIRF